MLWCKREYLESLKILQVFSKLDHQRLLGWTPRSLCQCLRALIWYTITFISPPSASPSPTAIGVIFVFGRIIVVIIITIIILVPLRRPKYKLSMASISSGHTFEQKRKPRSHAGGTFSPFPNFNAKNLPSKADKKSDEVLPLQCDRDIPSNK